MHEQGDAGEAGPHTCGLLQPTTGWRISASTGPARPKNVRAAPSQSTRARAPPRSRAGTEAKISTSVITTNGTLIAKISRHETASTRYPPTSGPITVAMPDQAVQEPIAAPRSSAGNAEMMSASALGVRSAPNAPCSARPAIRNSMRRRHGAQHGHDAEARDAEREHAPLTEDVAERAAHQDQRAERQQVRVRDPLLAGEAAAEVGADRGQRDVDRSGVETGHERAHDRREQRHLLVVAPAQAPHHALLTSGSRNARPPRGLPRERGAASERSLL